jgi:poly(A) polymerase
VSGLEQAIEAVLATRLVLPPEVHRLAERFVDAGRELYLVGGAVRDALLDRSGHHLDYDFATGAPPVETKSILAPLGGSIWTQGEAFGSIGLKLGDRSLEITTFRVDAYAPASRKPEVASAADIETDLSISP